MPPDFPSKENLCQLEPPHTSSESSRNQSGLLARLHQAEGAVRHPSGPFGPRFFGKPLGQREVDLIVVDALEDGVVVLEQWVWLYQALEVLLRPFETVRPHLLSDMGNCLIPLVAHSARSLQLPFCCY